MTTVHFSSERMDWETPQSFFDEVNAEFNLHLDVCATPQNAKLPDFLNPEEVDSLEEAWLRPRLQTYLGQRARCWMNPPYGRQIGKWMRKAYEESLNGALVVCLVPARTDTAWWHDYAAKGEIRFIRGRLKFDGHRNSAPFPSALVIFRPKH
jgi:phage N-6-adenine-methyltransferase